MTDLELFAGIVASDGHIKRNKFRLVVINKNMNFLEEEVVPLIKRLTGKDCKPLFNKSGYNGSKFLVFVNSEYLWTVLQEKFNIPAGKKSSTIRPPDLNGSEEKIDFLRGWFAGDGCVTTFRGRPRIETWSKSEEMIVWIRSFLEENDIKSSLCIVKGKGQFFLDIKRLESVKKFHDLIRIAHPDKSKKLKLLLLGQAKLGLYGKTTPLVSGDAG